ncbi:olfactory receptor 1019-like [Bombina bombina]|uniref:olfactory receptor 1019-like n=1 Tax=Bombina bombina TaxID=8345 RepID=UPI00235B030A|nr:olfactory receptor 1019-like [Bombina bombina]
MEQTNYSMVTYFIIKGISDAPELQTLIFITVLLIYLLTVSGNMTILLLVCLNSHLHTPMYFFLANLSILDMSCSTVTLHVIITSFISSNKTVSFANCLAQVYFFSCFTSNELLILSAMSYDRYAAICKPLHYHMVMNGRVCKMMAFVCWILGFIEIIPYLVLLLHISCYKSNIINHFFCDIMPVMKLSCSDNSALEILIYTEGLFILSMTPFLLTFCSYVFIINAILRIHSNIGRRKVFYTCSSHLTVVVLLYTTLFFQYLRPRSVDILESNKLFSLFNTAAVPILNPLIYSLKNKDVKAALKENISKIKLKV